MGVGNALSLAVKCQKLLEKEKISSELISFHSPKPLDSKLLKRLFTNKKLIITIEEHGLIGGVGSAILEWANNYKKDANKILRFGGPDEFLTGCGNQKEARNRIGLSSKKISMKIIGFLKKK